MRINISELAKFNSFINGYHPDLRLNEINGMTIDSRKVEQGDMYFALRGSRVDGHNYIQQAIKSGASAIVTENQLVDVPVPQIIVESSHKYLLELANAWWSSFSFPVIAITGSNGKTTTKELLSHIASNYLKIASINGNYNSTIGLPLSLFSLTEDNDFAILEIGSNSPGEISTLTELIKPMFGLITNIYAAHIGNFDNIENIAIEKSQLFNGLIGDGVAFVNIDDPFIYHMDFPSKIISYGFTSKCDFRGKISELNGEKFLYINEQIIDASIESKAMAHNTLAAYSIAATIGLSHNKISDSIQSFILPDGRGNIVHRKDYTIIDDTYNANLQSAITGINDAMDISPNNRIILIIGDMFELGKHTDAHHRVLGEYISEKKPNLVLTLGNYTHITSDICKSNGIETYHFDTHDKIINSLNKYLTPGDVIYIKGSRGMKMDKILRGIE
jgi:UDP-N-acetylmuramoyl-tripeptide--D-alanyl-D-alanine ligase